MNSRSIIKLLLSLTFSILILYFLYQRFDIKNIGNNLLGINYAYLLVFVLLILLQLYIAVFRWKYLLKEYMFKQLTYRQSFFQVVGSYSANLLIPAKMGEIIRVVWTKEAGERKKTLALVLFEKLLDLSSVFLIMIIFLFLLFIQGNKVNEFFLLGLIPFLLAATGIFLIYKFSDHFLARLHHLKKAVFIVFQKRDKALYLISISIVLWFVQISQFLIIFSAFKVEVPLDYLYAGNAMAVLAGALIPSVGGIGPRDATIIWFFSEYAAKSILASIGLISALRIIIPAIIGLPGFFFLTKDVHFFKKKNFHG